MTDKQLQNILQTESAKIRESIGKDDSQSSDDDFVKKVMQQLPKAESSMGVVWLIRMATWALGIVILLLFHRVFVPWITFLKDTLPSYIQYIVSYRLSTVSPMMIAIYGIIFAGVVIVVCKKEHLV